MPLAQMQAEVREVNELLGWWEGDVLFAEAMALLHTEVAEASDAWRKWGIDDVTGKVTTNHLNLEVHKPEGVGSEFADILIRLLDDNERYGAGIEEKLAYHSGAFGINDSFLVNMNFLHGLIVQASDAFEAGDSAAWMVTGWEGWLTRVLSFLLQLCEHYGIDLMAEYTRKVAFNRTRPYRHGDRKL
jgi:NTP pyrophosphatase (non-canonical NTP hydrolase)